MMRPYRIYAVQHIMCLLPSTRCFALKRWLLRWCGAFIGRNVRIVSSARFQLAGRFEVGDETWIGHDVLVVGGDSEVLIGARVDIGPRVTITTGSHELFTDRDRAAGKGYSLPVVIEDGVWVGASSTILGGVRIGRCSVVAAGAVVNKNVLNNTIVGGVPARRISTGMENIE